MSIFSLLLLYFINHVDCLPSPIWTLGNRSFTRGKSIYTARSGYLIMDENRYYWDNASFVPDPNRTLKCEVPFDATDKDMEDIYLHDYDNETYTINTNDIFASNIKAVQAILGGGKIRPEVVYFNCKSTDYCKGFYCVDQDAKYFRWIFLVIYCSVIVATWILVCWMEVEPKKLSPQALSDQDRINKLSKNITDNIEDFFTHNSDTRFTKANQ